ncbi:hypothetical protein NKR23_g5063 [Pleurostoma richardsiae]|uniref:RRM domain-containing protein n=1 Tax=Pleurostoma richardsiae TaxID=41990 RepID=A0AA38RTT3_9PEZI|nr:hypothetical protein NKR23_g5063 [Pleurostoma richardsiae]
MSEEAQSPVWRSAANWRGGAASPSGTPSSSNRPAWRDSNSPRPVRWGNSASSSGGRSAGGVGGDDAAAAEGRRIYLGNLPYSAGAEDVERLLREQGFAGFEKVHISVDALSGRNPGYCFAEFGDKATADRALEALAGVSLLDRQIKAGPCQPRRAAGQQGLQQEGRGGEGFERRARDGGAGPAQRWGDRGGERDGGSYRAGGRREEAAPAAEGAAEEKRRLYVGGLPMIETQEECEQEMRGLFGQFAVEAVSKPIAPHPSTQGKPGNHYYCFVDLATAEDALAALAALDGKPFRDGSLRVGVAKGEARRPRERPANAFSGWDRFRNGAEAQAEV